MNARDVRPTPCEDIVLTGRNFQTPNFLTSDPNDLVLTGAFVPFGTETQPGQVDQWRREMRWLDPELRPG